MHTVNHKEKQGGNAMKDTNKNIRSHSLEHLHLAKPFRGNGGTGMVGLGWG
jgi:hypothetical protein